jgi:hypothetical protein
MDLEMIAINYPDSDPESIRQPLSLFLPVKGWDQARQRTSPPSNRWISPIVAEHCLLRFMLTLITSGLCALMQRW